MCITFLSMNSHKQYKFILLFNRDEFFNRPTSSMNFHCEEGEHKDSLMYPLDIISGGTFLCVNVKNGNFCVLLNNPFEDFPYNPNTKVKRGSIAIDFCKSEDNYADFFTTLTQNQKEYNGFNIICGNMVSGLVYYFTNNNSGKFQETSDLVQFPMKLNFDIFGLSNNFIHDNCSIYSKKVEYGKKRIHEIIEKSSDSSEEEFIENLFSVMEDDTKLHEGEVDTSKFTNIEKDFAKYKELKNYLISSIFVRDSVDGAFYQYGTRHTIILTLDYESNFKIFEHCDDVIQNNSIDILNKDSDYLSLGKRDKCSMKVHKFTIN